MHIRLLSSRTIYFGLDGVHRGCCIGILCESKPFYDTSNREHQNAVNMKSIFLALESLNSVPLGRSQKRFQNAWHQVIKVYSKTELRYKKDKLVAIAGNASLIQHCLSLQASFRVSRLIILPFLTC
jgi:hypothetical protein